MDQVDCVRPGIPVSRFFTPSPPRPLSQRHGGQASKRPVEAAAPAAGMDAPSKSIGGERAHTRLENAPRFPQSLGRVLRSSVPGPRPHLPQAPPQGYFLNGATIPSKVTFLNGLTGPAPSTASTASGIIRPTGAAQRSANKAKRPLRHIRNVEMPPVDAGLLRLAAFGRGRIGSGAEAVSGPASRRSAGAEVGA
jgi:hypothetical protein